MVHNFLQNQLAEKNHQNWWNKSQFKSNQKNYLNNKLKQFSCDKWNVTKNPKSFSCQSKVIFWFTSWLVRMIKNNSMIS